MSKNDTSSWHLVATSSWLAGHRFPLKDKTILGRETKCDITIAGTHLSRQHAQLVIRGDRVQITDLNSANGTYIGDQRVSEVELKTGDTIRFDVLEFILEGPGSTRTNPLEKKGQSGELKDKVWLTKPTSPGNRPGEEIRYQTQREKLVQLAWQASMGALALVAAAAIGYLVLQI